MKPQSPYNWVCQKLKKVWNKIPLKIICDECQPLNADKNLTMINFICLGIEKNFINRMLNCGWHIHRNIVKNFRSLTKNNQGLFKKVSSLPFISRKEKT